MKPIDLSGLIQGVIVIIFLAMSLGKYDILRGFAIREAQSVLKPMQTKSFFPKNYTNIKTIE